MNKLVEIGKAWITAANPSPEQKLIAEHRLAVCDGCEHKTHQDIMNFWYCNACGCPLNKKVFSPMKDSCPKQKWEQ